MSFSRIIIIGAIALFGVITVASIVKKTKNNREAVFNTKQGKIQEIIIENVVDDNRQKESEKEIQTIVKKETPPIEKTQNSSNEKTESQPVVKDEIVPVHQEEQVSGEKSDKNLPEADIVDRLFVTDSSRLPIVETIVYTPRVPWQKGRPAWIADYAAHYSTTRHFIARSLNKKPDYFTQKISPGDRFNVFKEGKNISFYLLIDINRAKLWFYYLDEDANERTLLKTYKVGLGRKDSKRLSGSLTPTGKYLLGSKVAIYKPNILGYFQDKKMEMIKIFGTRWIPFDKEMQNCSEAAKGLGIHGAPWVSSPNGELLEDRSKIGKYDSDGCVRLYSEDIEEIFSIIISKPATIELVNDFYDAKLPGMEKKY